MVAGDRIRVPAVMEPITDVGAFTIMFCRRNPHLRTRLAVAYERE